MREETLIDACCLRERDEELLTGILALICRFPAVLMYTFDSFCISADTWISYLLSDIET